MDERMRLQEFHAIRNLCSHVQENHFVDLGVAAAAEIVEEVAPGHELRDDVEGRLPGTHPQ